MTIAEIELVSADQGLATGWGVTKIATSLTDNRGPFNLYALPNCMILGNTYGIGGYIDKNIFYIVKESINHDEFILEYTKSAVDYVNQCNISTEYLPGQWAFLNDYWAANFWHWMTEFVAKIIILESSGYRGGYIVPAPAAHVADCLTMLNIGPDRVHHTLSPATQVESMIVCDQFTGTTAFSRFPTLLPRIREAFFAGLDSLARPRSAQRRLYVAREHSRRVVNEADLLALVGGYGITERVLMERLPLAQQIALVRDAELLIGPHGAGMALTMFMPPGTTVIEMFPPTYINPCMRSTSRLLKQRWHLLPSRYIAEQGPYPHGLDIVADLESIEQILVSIA